ncbi:peroxisomal membrane protein PEX13-like isoform X1 [Acropora muricata]|uniref:peroxisomal membrane protein PEX13-like isoform X1 n=1 Tax=Acropora millepora TaxID=45264 RepID=UPI0010FCBB42|nr:peroxisomal membrane protein PEX13-like isoform X1 [Acropora millepora]
MVGSSEEGEGDHVIARAEYDFDGEGEKQLSFRAGDILRLAPKGKQPRIRGWLLGTADGLNEGVVPANYVKILGLRRGKKESKGIKKGNAQESQTPQIEQSRRSQTNMDQEFDKIIEKTDSGQFVTISELTCRGFLK